MEKIQHFQAQFKAIPIEEAKAAKTRQGASTGVIIKGYASTPAVDRYNDIVEPEAFRKSIINNYAKNPIMLFQHDPDKPIGKATHLSIDSNGLYLEGVINDKDINPKIEAGFLQTLSIGYIPKSWEVIDKNGDKIDMSNEAQRRRAYSEEGVKRVLKEVDLVEVSVVSIPANTDALFTMQKSLTKFFDATMQEYENDVKYIQDNNSLKETIMKDANLLEKKEGAETTEEEVVAPVEEVVEEATPEAVEPTKEEETVEEEVVEEEVKEEENTEVEAEEASEEDTEGEEPVAVEKDGDVEVVEKDDEEPAELTEDAKLLAKALLEEKAKVAELEKKLKKTPVNDAIAFGASEKSVKTEKPEPVTDEKTGIKEAFIKASL